MLNTRKQNLKITFDGKPIFSSSPGISRVSIQLVNLLTELGHSILILLPNHEILVNDRNPLDVRALKANPFHNLNTLVWYKSELGKRIKQTDSDVFFATGHKVPQQIAQGVKVISFIHDVSWRKYPWAMPLKSLIGELISFKNTLAKSDIILTVSESTKNDLVSYYPRHLGKVKVCYPYFNIGCNSELPSRSGLLFVGDLRKRKNVSRLIQAYLRLPLDCRQKNNLIIAGNFSRQEIVKRFEYLLNNPSMGVVFCPKPNDATLSRLMKSSCFLVVPSIHEGFGLPIIEAFSWGVPVILSNISIFREIAGDLGSYFDPFDSESIEITLLNALENYQNLKTDFAKLQLRAKYFSKSDCLSRLQSIINELS